MKILILAYHVSSDVKAGGGTSRFFRTVRDVLIEMGHEVVLSNEPEKYVDEPFDLIICSHFMHRIKDNPAPKIQISHGIVNDEGLHPGAQKYISISEEVKAWNLKYGIFSEVVPQPIPIPRGPIKPPNKTLQNILVIRRHENEPCPFKHLGEKYNLRYSDPDTPIENQIRWADLCISLGRGALEASSYGRPVIVADNREYMGSIGDGYVSRDNIDGIAKNNFSGRRYRHEVTREWVLQEISKYNAPDGEFLREYVKEHHEAHKIVQTYLDMVKKPKTETTKGLISIIVPVWNQHEMSYDCIQTVMESTELPYEIIVVDNGSDPPFKPPFSGFNAMEVIRNDENKGFPVAVNQGIQKAKGEYVVLLNNDVVVSQGAINRLVSWMDESDIDERFKFDIIGPLTNYAAGKQRADIAVYTNLDEFQELAEEIAESNEWLGEPVNWIIGFCMAFKRSVYDDVGQFDESLWPCSGEEIDFCYRARAKGYSVGIAHDVYVHHEGSKSFGDLQSDQGIMYEDLCRRNDAYLAKKYGNDFFFKQEIQSGGMAQ
jgi:GT2 family glycosyltransferase